MASREVKESSAGGRAERFGGCVITGFLILFPLIGVALGVFGVREILREQEALGWPVTSGVVVDGKVETRRSDESTSYALVLRWTFTAPDPATGEPRTFESRGYNLGPGTFPKRADARAQLKQFPVGAKVDVHYNPADPVDSVLSLDGSDGWWMLTFAGVWLAFVLIIGLVIGYSNRRSRKADGGAGTKRHGEAPMTHDLPVPLIATARGSQLGHRLLRAQSRRTELLGLLIITLVWNGIMAGIFYAVFRDGIGWDTGAIFGLVCFGAFGVIGVLLIVGSVIKVLQFMVPEPVVEVSRWPLAVGEGFELFIQPPAQRIEKITVTLRCEESVSYRAGTSTRTETHMVLEQTLLEDAGVAREAQTGKYRRTMTVEIPPEAMHSFDQPNNHINWTVRVQCAVRMWPDTDDSYALLVVTPEAASTWRGGPSAAR